MAGMALYIAPLITAVRNQDIDLVKQLLKEGDNPNILDFLPTLRERYWS